MTREIRLYIEGGGDGKNGKTFFRQAWGTFFRDLRELAQAKRIRWEIIAGGSREKTFGLFQKALIDHDAAFNVLLVDSEIMVQQPPWQHLQECDGWTKPSGVDDRHCPLMAQAMEAWFLADPQALANFYGRGFKLNALPKRQDPERIPKSHLVAFLNKAARSTNKPRYHKIVHACKILERLDIITVALKAKHCRRFIKEIEAEIDASE